MPRLKKSQGYIKFRTPIPDEFQRYICYELENAKNWSKLTIKGGLTGKGSWLYQLVQEDKTIVWTINWDRQRQVLEVSSALPQVVIRKGLLFNMGHGELRIEQSTS